MHTIVASSSIEQNRSKKRAFENEKICVEGTRIDMQTITYTRVIHTHMRNHSITSVVLQEHIPKFPLNLRGGLSVDCQPI